jgi:UDP-N-acetyl-D-mannosaminuronic acid transferase (WecB/TagA/CpsF family)
MLNDTGIKLVKKLVTDHQELVLDYTVMFIANMSIEGITAADLKKVTNAATQAFTYARTLDENMRKLLKVDELVTNDNIAVVLFLTKLNIKRVINLVNECKQK